MQIVTATDVIKKIKSGSSVVFGGFGSCGHPDVLTAALAKNFSETGEPRNLTYLFAAGQGDKKNQGLNMIAQEGLVSKAIGGFWGLCPQLVKLAQDGLIEAHNWPQGVISKLFSAIAANELGVVTHVGMGTFIDPLFDGGVIDTKGSSSLIKEVSIDGHRRLLYPSMPIDLALLRGTSSDGKGNISFEDETSFMDALAQAMAVKRSGGTVVVQVKNIVDFIPPQRVKIPSIFVDYVVVVNEEQHPQTYGRAYDERYTNLANVKYEEDLNESTIPLHKFIIAYRAAIELSQHKQGANINLGIGIPALIGSVASSLGIEGFTLSVESGLIGGIPDEGLSFGASFCPNAVIEQAALFDFYDGGGIDVAFLGFAQIDHAGNVNVSKFGGKLTGAGGFINISQAAQKVVFCGTLTAGGLEVSISDGQLIILKEGKERKFVRNVSHLTFNSKRLVNANVEVVFITERAVFRLSEDGVELCEIAPHISVASLQKLINFDLKISADLREMPGPWSKNSNLGK